MNQFIKKLVNEYLQKNQTKDVLTMDKAEIDKFVEKVIDFCTNHENLKAAVTDELTNSFSMADFYDIQVDAAKTASKNAIAEVCEKACETKKPEAKAPEAKKPVARRGRKPKNANNMLTTRKADIPKSVDSNRIYTVYTRDNGKRMNAMYGVLSNELPRKTAITNLRKTYAKKVNTHYLNVSLRLADSKYKFRELKKDATFWTDESAAAYMARKQRKNK